MIVVVSLASLFIMVASANAELKCGMRNCFSVGIFKSSSLRTCASSRRPIVLLASFRFALDKPISVSIRERHIARLALLNSSAVGRAHKRFSDSAALRHVLISSGTSAFCASRAKVSAGTELGTSNIESLWFEHNVSDICLPCLIIE